LALLEAQRAVSDPKKPNPNAPAHLWRVDMKAG
jgi:hypothetical protein